MGIKYKNTTSKIKTGKNYSKWRAVDCKMRHCRLSRLPNFLYQNKIFIGDTWKVIWGKTSFLWQTKMSLWNAKTHFSTTNCFQYTVGITNGPEKCNMSLLHLIVKTGTRKIISMGLLRCTREHTKRPSYRVLLNYLYSLTFLTCHHIKTTSCSVFSTGIFCDLRK